MTSCNASVETEQSDAKNNSKQWKRKTDRAELNAIGCWTWDNIENYIFPLEI